MAVARPNEDGFEAKTAGAPTAKRNKEEDWLDTRVRFADCAVGKA